MKKDLFKLFLEKQDDGKGEPEPKEEEKEPVEEEGEKGKEENKQEEKPVKTFTQEEVNALNAKAKNKFLKELGFENIEAYKKHLADVEAKKPLEEKLKGVEAAKAEALTRAEKAEAKLAAIEAGVSSKKADKVVKLAQTYEGDDIAAKIKAVLEDFPELKGDPSAPKDKFGNPVGEKKTKSRDKELEDIFTKALTGEK